MNWVKPGMTIGGDHGMTLVCFCHCEARSNLLWKSKMCFFSIDFIYCKGLKSIATKWVVPMGLVNSALLVNKRAIGSTHL